MLDGILGSSYSSHSLEYVRGIITGWLKEKGELEVIDRRKAMWKPDELGSVAENYFGGNVHLLAYIGDTLVAIGSLPERDALTAIAIKSADLHITEDDLRKAVKKYGLFNER